MRKLLTTRFRFHEQKRLCGQLASAALRQDLRLGALREELSAHDDGGVGEDALAEHLENAVLGDVDHQGCLDVGLAVLGLGLGVNQGPDLVKVDGRAVELVVLLVEITHTDLTEVTRVVFIKPDAVVVLTTGVTATGRVLPVLADTTVAAGLVSALLAVTLEPGSH